MLTGRTLKENLSGLSAGQEIYTRLSWIIWDWKDEDMSVIDPGFRLAFDVLDSQYLRPIGALIYELSFGHEGTARWLERYRGRTAAMG